MQPHDVRPADYAATKAQLDRLSKRLDRSQSVDGNALDPLFAVLDRREIPGASAPDSKDRAAVDLALLAIRVLSGCRAAIRTNDDVRSRIIDLWPDCWAWMRYIQTYCVDAPIYGPAIVDAGAKAVGYGLMALSQPHQLRVVMGRTPGVRKLITDIWLGKEHDIVGLHASTLTMSLIQFIDPNFAPVEWTEILEAAGGYNGLAQVAIRRIHKILAVDPFDGERMCGHLGLIYYLSVPSNSTLHLSLLQAGLAPALVECIRISSAKAAKDIASVECLRESMKFIQTSCLETSHGLMSVSQAVKSGLLPLVFGNGDAARLLGPEDSALLLNLPTDCVALYLIYRPIIRVVAKSLSCASRQTQHRWRTMNEWASFLEMVDARRASKALFERTSLRICSHCHVAGASLKKCSACAGPRYCSEECQKQNWKQHRVSCLEFVKLTCDASNGKGSPISLNEQRFAFLVASGYEELRSRAGTLNEMLRSMHASVPPEHLNFTVFLMACKG